MPGGDRYSESRYSERRYSESRYSENRYSESHFIPDKIPPKFGGKDTHPVEKRVSPDTLSISAPE
jgi:hypothetical protein